MMPNIEHDSGGPAGDRLHHDPGESEIALGITRSETAAPDQGPERRQIERNLFEMRQRSASSGGETVWTSDAQSWCRCSGPTAATPDGVSGSSARTNSSVMPTRPPRILPGARHADRVARIRHVPSEDHFDSQVRDLSQHHRSAWLDPRRPCDSEEGRQPGRSTVKRCRQDFVLGVGAANSGCGAGSADPPSGEVPLSPEPGLVKVDARYWLNSATRPSTPPPTSMAARPNLGRRC